MKKLIKNLMIFTFGLLLYPISANAAETYKLDLEWFEENSMNRSFISNTTDCGFQLMILTKYGEEFFASEDAYVDGALSDDFLMKFLMFETENSEQKLKKSVDITIYDDAIVVKDMDLVFYKDDKNLLTKVEHKKKDVSKVFILQNQSLGYSGDEIYFNYNWGNLNVSDQTCWYKLTKI